MTDAVEVLLFRIKNGEQSAFEELASLYAPLIESMSTQFARSFAAKADSVAVGEQDLAQEARFALYRAAKTYDAEKKGVTFGLYAKICVRNALVSLLRRVSALARVSHRETGVEGMGGRDALSELLTAAETGALRERIREALSPYENSIFEQYISGMSVKQIALNGKRPEKSVSNALYRIRVKIKGLLSSD